MKSPREEYLHQLELFMEMSTKKSTHLFLLLIMLTLLCYQVQPKAQDDSSYTEIPVGVILDMRSWVGKTVHSCITIALFEFYKVNDHYQTRIVVHNRDSRGETLHALRTALDLLEQTKVQAIIGSDSTAEAKFHAVLGDEARIPILSLSPAPSSHNHPYFLQIAHDETTQFKGIAAMAESFGWKDLIVVCEDNDNGRDMATIMANAVGEKSISVTYRSLISTSASNELVQEELQKLSTMQTKVFVLHTSPSLASYLLLNAKDLGMMDEGYKWIITSKTMDFLNILDGEVMESMQGVVGFRSYIPQSADLHKFTWKWRKEYGGKNINSYGIWAHDAVSALAMAVEKQVLKSNLKNLETTGSNQRDTTLLNQMLRISFQGLGGVFQFRNERITTHVLEIINVIGKGEKRVGFWTTDAAFIKKLGQPNSYSNDVLKAIIWPGGITSDSMRLRSKNLRIVVPAHSRSRRLFQVYNDARNNSTIVSGFCADVFLAAFAALGQDVAFDFIPIRNNTKVGLIDYNDLIDEVYSGEFDAAIGDISITANRSLYVDFTWPYTDLGFATISRNADASMWIFMEPLSSNLWLVSACFFILLALVIWILEHRTNQEFQGSRGQQVGTTIWFAFSTLVYAHKIAGLATNFDLLRTYETWYERVPGTEIVIPFHVPVPERTANLVTMVVTPKWQELQSNLSRFVVIVWLFVVLVLTSSYTATLSSLLTIQQIQLASNRNLIGYSRSFQLGGIRNFTPGTRLESYPTFEAYADDLSRGSKKGGVDAIIEEIPYVKAFLAEYPSGYSMTISEATTNGFGFAFARGSPWAPEISRQIARLRVDGTLNKLENKWFNQESRDSVPTTKILCLKELRGLFVISGVSMAVAVFLFMLYLVHEKLYFSYTMLAGGKLAFILRLLVRRTGNAGE
ncbi:hypothetical protein OSB04_001109 [Centaurea solstitialis]|uniref:Glutamate receptor n=1 Tax=Centaurea solstitialis TaxID=347529 RepID=A0AA38TXV3_9ASTR|nr:hypothetical protein OSB04_001109 [Centaurea solstitialis]